MYAVRQRERERERERERAGGREGASKGAAFFSQPLSLHPLQAVRFSLDPFLFPSRSTALMQSGDMRRRRRRRHDPIVDHSEDASCKNKRTGSLGMSRDSVLYRSPAYIDTNLCPPQAVLCICRIYIHHPSRILDLLLRPPSATPAVLRFLFLLWFLPFPLPPFSSLPSTSRSVSLSVSVQSALRPTLSRSLASPVTAAAAAGFQHAYIQRKPEVCARVCVAPPSCRYCQRRCHPPVTDRPSARGAQYVSAGVAGEGGGSAHSCALATEECAG